MDTFWYPYILYNCINYNNILILYLKMLPVPSEPNDCDFGACSITDWFFYSSRSLSRWSHTLNLSSDDKKSSSPRGLPWWFVFIAWFLVAATSSVSGFFTMLYGLHYGKENSIKWLISMVISFLESLFITQPLKVRASEIQPPVKMSSSAATAGRQCNTFYRAAGFKI